ncbi:MAG: helix-hairpin-helix domain-containing protein [Candidatus Omnitrophota bacterium]
MFSLTRQEKGVILFLLAMALAGSGISFLRKKYSRVETVIECGINTWKVDLNKADKEMLMGVPGIGEKIASRIIEYRSEKGAFKDMEELRSIKGVSAYRFEKIKESLSVK